MTSPSPLSRFSLRSLLIAVAVVSVVIGVARMIHLRHRPNPLVERARTLWAPLVFMRWYTEGVEMGYARPHWFDEQAIHPKNSWRYAVSAYPPFTELNPPPADPTAPWDRPSYQAWDDRSHGLYCMTDLKGQPRARRYTRIMAIRGDDAAFDYFVENSLESLQEKSPEAILFVEVANSRTPWMQRGDLDAATLPRRINPPAQTGIGSDLSSTNFLVAFADGNIWALDASMPFAALEPFLTMSGSNAASRAETLGPYRIRIPHDGGRPLDGDQSNSWDLGF